MKFMRSVTSTSCTLRVSRITAASPAQSAPAATPAAAAKHRHERRRRRGQSEGRPGGGEAADRDLPLAADVMTRARKQSATPTPVRR